MIGGRPAKPPSAYKAAPRSFNAPVNHCPRCDKAVYAAEQASGPGGREYHKGCLRCVGCKKTVAQGSFEEHEGDPYCKHCYNKQFGPKGYGHGGAMTGEYRDPILDRSPLSSPARRDSFNSSAITSGSARDSLPYPPAPSSPSRSEQSTSWRDRLAALNLEDEHESEQRRDSKGSDEPVIRSNGQGRTTIRMPMGVEEDSEDDAVRVPSNAVRAGQEETEWEEEDQVSTRPPPTTSEALKPAPPPKPAFPRPSSSTSAASPAYQPSSPARSFPRPSSPLKQSTSLPRPPSTANTTTSAIPGSSPLPPLGRSSTPARPFNPTANLGLLAKSQGGSDGCRRCGTAVYFAEKVMASGHKWHKRCLRCAGCSKALDSHLVERENLPYCKRCYDDNWGMKSQGFVLRPGLH